MSDIYVDDFGYVYKDGRQIAHFNGCALENSGNGNAVENSLGTIGLFDRGSGYIRDSNYNLVGSLDSFGNVYRSTSGYPIATNCKSIELAAALVLLG